MATAFAMSNTEETASNRIAIFDEDSDGSNQRTEVPLVAIETTSETTSSNETCEFEARECAAASNVTVSRGEPIVVDFQARSLRELSTSIAIPVARYAVLCGNVGCAADGDEFSEYLRLFCSRGWERVFLVPGPEELRGSGLLDGMRRLRAIERAVDNLTVLQRDWARLETTDKGAREWRIAGATLWTKLDETNKRQRELARHFWTTDANDEQMKTFEHDGTTRLDELIKITEAAPEFRARSRSLREKRSASKAMTFHREARAVEAWNAEHERDVAFVHGQLAWANEPGTNRTLVMVTHSIPYGELVLQDCRRRDRDADYDYERFRAVHGVRWQTHGDTVPLWFCSCVNAGLDQRIVEKIHDTLFYGNCAEYCEAVGVVRRGDDERHTTFIEKRKVCRVWR